MAFYTHVVCRSGAQGSLEGVFSSDTGSLASHERAEIWQVVLNVRAANLGSTKCGAGL